MATIQPFQPILPNPFYADQLVFTKPQAESVSGDFNRAGDLKPLKILLETGARLRPENAEGQLLAYQDIKETLRRLLANETLYKERTAGIYVYEVEHPTYRQTGIWAVTDLEDHVAGKIKIHELTFADSVRRMKNYREATGLEGSPILLTYSPDDTINAIIATTKARDPEVAWGNQQGTHRIWKIAEGEILQQLIEAFKNVGTIYLADGHHRLSSAALTAKEHPGFKYISSLYMAFDQVRIEAYHRVVVSDNTIAKPDLIKALTQHFYIRESSGDLPVQPVETHHMGLLLENEWYHLVAKPHTYFRQNSAEVIDAAILQEFVLSEVFGIEDPKTDQRLKCAGGAKALKEIAVLLQAHPSAIAFTLCPLSAGQLVAVADAGQILPPKSTWIDPKIPYGLLLYKHD